MYNKTCRICLALDVKMFKLGNTEGKHLIENIFKQNGYNQDLMDGHFICFECKALLDKLNYFIKRVLKAQDILYQMVVENKILTPSVLKQVDRRITGLNLVEHFNYVDIFITEDENTIKTMIKQENAECNESDSEPEIECKIESNLDPDPLVNRELEVDFGVEFDNKFAMPAHQHQTDIKDSNIKFDYVDPSDTILYYETFVNGENVTNQHEFDDMSSADPVKEEASDDFAIETSKQFIGKRKYKKTDKHKKKADRSLKQSKPASKRKPRTQRKKDLNITKETTDNGHRRGQFEYGGDEICDESGQPLSKPEPKYPAKCEHCNYEIPNRTAHFHHYLIEHKDKKYPHAFNGKRFVCQYCGIISTTKSRHIDHELIHGTESNFPCTQCPKSFANRHRLLKHTYRSHPVRMLECDYCGKKVKARESLMIHIRTHTGEKPFKCPLCGAGFAHRGNIRPHIRANHEHYLPDHTDVASKTKNIKCEPKDTTSESLKQLHGPKDTRSTSAESENNKLCSSEMMFQISSFNL